MLAKPLTAQEFAAAYGARSLVRLAERGATGRVPEEAITFLRSVGLPARIVYHEFVSGAEVTFRQLGCGLWPLRAEGLRKPPPESWSRLWVIGDEYFVQGAAWWCIAEGSGHVVRLDPDVGDDGDLVNTSVARLASALLAAIRWTETVSYTAPNWSAQLDSLEQRIRSLDTEAMEDRRGFWRRWFQVVRSEVPRPDEPGESGFRRLRQHDRGYRDRRREPSHRFGPEARRCD